MPFYSNIGARCRGAHAPLRTRRNIQPADHRTSRPSRVPESSPGDVECGSRYCQHHAPRAVVEPPGKDGRRGKGASPVSDYWGVALRRPAGGRSVVAWRVRRDPAGRPEGSARRTPREGA
eukprot:1752070-Rhodomonas_salina.2